MSQLRDTVAAQDVALPAKVAALSRPDCYPVPVREVRPLETHMSWVFLTDAHAWKLKKPVGYDHQDFRSAEGRRFYCLEELRLNRRLAPDVYLDVLPLSLEADGRLRVAGGGAAVDWVVQMRRLPADRLLDSLLSTHRATAQQMRAIGVRLAAFHRSLPPANLAASDWRSALLGEIAGHEIELCRPQWSLPRARLQALARQLRRFVQRHQALLDARMADGRVVEGHGDLRPEHVWLGEPLAVIDALEFSLQLRTQDGLDEVGFLALECERAHARQLGQALLDAYRAGSADDAPPALLHFYQARKAWARARLAIAHLREARYRQAPLRWRMRTLRYLVLAQRHLRAARLMPAAAR